MRILLLNNFHYRRGGSETVYLNIADLLKKHGHDVEFYSIKHKENYPARFSNIFSEGSNACKNKLKGSIKYISNKNAAKNLETVIRKFKPDIAHIHLIWGGLTKSVLKVLSQKNIPVLHTVHDFRMVCPAYTFMTPEGKICEQCRGKNFMRCIINRCGKGSLIQSVLMATEAYLRIWDRTYNDFTHIHYVSEFSKKKHEEYNNQLKNIPSTILYNFVPFPTIRIEPANRNVYTFCGRLSKEKGVETLLKAFAKRPDLKLRIIGTGPMETKLKILANETKMTNVEFTGYLNGDTLTKAIASSRFVCIPSECYENNPMSALESFSMGVPVISANVGGCPEIVKSGITGFLFESGNVESLIQILDQSNAMSDAEYARLCQTTYSTYLNDYTPESYYPKLIKIYQNTIKNKN